MMSALSPFVAKIEHRDGRFCQQVNCGCDGIFVVHCFTALKFIQMSANKCPKCGSTEGVLLGASGEVLSCVSCQRSARKDELDQASLAAAARSTRKDAIDLGPKIAGVTIAC